MLLVRWFSPSCKVALLVPFCEGGVFQSAFYNTKSQRVITFTFAKYSDLVCLLYMMIITRQRDNLVCIYWITSASGGGRGRKHALFSVFQRIQKISTPLKKKSKYCFLLLITRVKKWVSERVSPRVSLRLLAKFFATKSLAKSLAESLGSDPMHDSRRDSLRDSFFYAGRPLSIDAKSMDVKNS